MNKYLKSSSKIFAYILAIFALFLFFGRFYSYGLGATLIFLRWVIVILCFAMMIVLRFQNSKLIIYTLLGIVFLYSIEWTWYHIQYQSPKLVEEPSLERQAKFLTQNLKFLGGDDDKTLNTLFEENADVLVVQELTPEWKDKILLRFDSIYPYLALHPMNGTNGLGIFSKFKINSSKIVYSTANRLMAQSALLDIHGEEVNLYNIQLSPTQEFKRSGDEILTLYNTNIKARQKEWKHLDQLITYETSKNSKIVIMGDANTLDFELLYRQIRKKFIDVFGFTGVNMGLNYPYNVHYPPFPIVRFDYIFVNENITPIASELIESSGSDHLPFNAVLEF